MARFHCSPAARAGPLRSSAPVRPAAKSPAPAAWRALDTPRRQLRGAAGPRHLTPKAFELLTLLVREAPRVLTKQELHERLWPDTHVSDATLVGLVKEVRRALDDRVSDAPLIRTVHRVGYAFTAEVASTGPSLPPGSAGARHWLVSARAPGDARRRRERRRAGSRVARARRSRERVAPPRTHCGGRPRRADRGSGEQERHDGGRVARGRFRGSPRRHESRPSLRTH